MPRILVWTVIAMAVSTAAQAQSTSYYGAGGAWNQYTAPPWGQYPGTAWGSYQGTIGENGWNYYQQIVGPSAEQFYSRSNAAPASGYGNAATGATLFHPADTRLKGRNQP